MIGYIKGNILRIVNGNVLIENNGIGYEVACSSSACQKLNVNQVGELYTYLAVREDGLFLYGFASEQEKNMFLKLITVSGVGPKMGITILSGMSISDLALRIATQDVKGLSSVKGLGKKTAERIILELREKISTEEVDCNNVPKQVACANKEVNQDALIALMGLGFTRSESVDALMQAVESGATTIEQMVTYALRNMGR